MPPFNCIHTVTWTHAHTHTHTHAHTHTERERGDQLKPFNQLQGTRPRWEGTSKNDYEAKTRSHREDGTEGKQRRAGLRREDSFRTPLQAKATHQTIRPAQIAVQFLTSGLVGILGGVSLAWCQVSEVVVAPLLPIVHWDSSVLFYYRLIYERNK